MEIGWIYYGFSGAIANFVVWISLFFPSVNNEIKSDQPGYPLSSRSVSPRIDHPNVLRSFGKSDAFIV
jgi:hypothetical protein